jgi:copper chaperone CopZ
MERLKLTITGMSCGHCVSRVGKALAQLPGVTVEQVEVGSAQLSYDSAKVSQQRITEAVGELGFEARQAS